MYPASFSRSLILILVALLQLSSWARAELTISEFMPNNDRTLADEDGQFPDWIEIQNQGPLANLGGYSLTDDPAFLNKWAFPALDLPGGGFLVVFASGKNRTNDLQRLHSTFQLNAGGGYLALVKDGTNIVSSFTYPAMKEDVSYGVSQNRLFASMLLNSAPQILVPTEESQLAADWSSPSYLPGPFWFTGSAPAALGFDTNQSPPIASNLAVGGTATQSTTSGTNAANRAINGSTNDFSQTLPADNAPFWQVTLASEAAIQQVILYNRSGCCGSRLRDITVEILATNEVTTNFVSALLNPENAGYSYPNGPGSLTIDLTALTGSPVAGKIVRIRRTPDPDLSGTGGQGTIEESSVLALADVTVLGTSLVSGSSEVNLARTGTPTPTATQSTSLSSFTANLAIDGNLGNFTHTAGTDANPTWTLNLGRRALINAVTLHNRDSCCGSRLRDITVRILGSDSNTVIYTSPLLNPENAGFSYPNGPDNLHLVVTNGVVGQFIQVRRTPDPDLSGSGGQGNADEAAVLALGEVLVLGHDLNGYTPFIRTDLQSRMLGQNASAFVRIPFHLDATAGLESMNLQLRYDDGFAVFLNGTELTRRNAPSSLAWNSSATADRDLISGLTSEFIDLSANLALLASGQNILAFHGQNSSSTNGDFLLQPELTITRLEVTSNVFLYAATPGSLNVGGHYIDEVADTAFSVDRGFFDTPFSLAITSGTPDAIIYYSFNADEPGPGKGVLYTGPITITNTTVLRARAYKDGWKPSNVDTHSYIFLADVIYQAADWPATRVPPPNFPSSWGNNAMDYGMDPNIVNNYSVSEWREALTQIPTMSVVTEMPNLFNPTIGIYANALQHGADWERPASLELLDPAGAEHGRFQENCGLRIRGGFSRNPQFVKHSFRIFFRRAYGAGKLDYPLFEEEGAQEFETFDLRTSQNYSWPREGNIAQGGFDTMVREVFCRETLGVMGQPYRRSRYYHLYLNGQYWGIYETDERPEASYGETYFGGDKENFDVVKCGNHVAGFVTEATDGNMLAWSNLWTMTRSMVTNSSNSNYFRILGRNGDGTRNTNLPVMLDVDNLIDYMLGIFWTGDGDATLSSFLGNNQPNNWFGMRDRSNPDVGFRFFNSDAEHTMGSPNSQVDRTGPFGGSNQGNFAFSNPQWMHEELMNNAEYRLRFADHVQKHFFHDGALTARAATNRFLRKANQITKAIRAYSARWGDAVREPPYNETNWQAAISFVVSNWIPPRTGIVLGQLRNDNLFPSIAAPEFSQRGGEVPAGYALEMLHTNSTGAILYTTDGSDPRLVGGGVSPSAQSYSAPLEINAPTTIRARVLAGGNWSPILDYVFYPPQDLSKLLVTEIMYHPPALNLVDGDEFEFLELKNAGTNTLTLSGYRFNGINFSFTNGTILSPGAFFVLVRNPSQFATKYPSVVIHGVYGGRLDNGGENITLSHPLGGRVLSVSYDDLAPWPVTPDGFGFSLVPRNANANPDPDNPANWRASSLAGGSPGADDPAMSIRPVLINEVLSHSEVGIDFIELFNPSESAVDLSGWFLTDDPAQPQKYRIRPNTQIAPLSYLAFDETDFNPTPGTNSSFSLSARGDEVYLFSGDAATNLTGFSHGFSFGAAPDGETIGRHIISTGEEHFTGQIAASPEGPNVGPRVGPVVINEIMYHPATGDDEFIELKNLTTNAVPLFDALDNSLTWRIDGIGFDFPTNIVLPPSALLLVVGIDPEQFRAKYNVATQTLIVGPFGGTLQDSGERLELQKPDWPDTNGIAFVDVDEVRFNDKPPWPVAADGSGPSLQRKNSAAYGNDPANWTAAVATPGEDLPAGASPLIISGPQSQTVFVGQTAAFNVAAQGAAPLNYQWRFNGDDIPSATSSNLLLANVQPSQAGTYSVIVFNSFGSDSSALAQLTVKRPPTIFSHPTNTAVRPGSTATFTVNASGNGFLRYQWQFNGTNIPGATSPSLAITNAQLTNDGLYTVSITDNIGTTLSNPARLILLVDPIIVQGPVSQSVAAGSSFVLSLTVTNTATLPMGYRLRRNNVNLGDTHVTLNERTVFFTITNAQAAFTNWGIVATNLAKSSGNLATCLITVLADSDGDGLPDSWEAQYGFGTNNAADRDADGDGDLMRNWEEYVAGTDPTNAASFLKIELTVPARVTFGALAAKTYTLEYNDTLAIDNWRKLADFGARSTNRTETFVDPSATSQRFYRIATPRSPDR